MIRVRFAPVPSGNLHPGGLKVFLINWLFAKKYNGRFILRFEDTDPRISFSEYRESLFRTLHRLGFEEELEVMNQGERHHIYKKAALELVRLGRAYPCFCTGNDLIQRLKNKGFPSSGEMVRYDGFCKNLTSDEIHRKLYEGQRPAYRLKVDPQIIYIEDKIKGHVRFDTGLMGDFIILRNDGTGLYNFACVVDDILTGVTHVIRGEDHLVNTPKQILIYQALEAPPPQFAHIPLFLGNRGEKYSKRTASLSAFQLMRQGFLPEAILNYIFYAGRKKVDRRQILCLDEMIEQFDLSKISPSYCRFDIEQLKYFNRQAIRKRSDESIEGEILDFLDGRGLLKERPEEGKLEALRELLPELRKRTPDMVELSLSYYTLLQNIIKVGKSGLESPSCRESAIETSPVQAAFPSIEELPIQAAFPSIEELPVQTTFPSIEELPVQATFLSLEKAKPFVLAKEDQGREAHPSENRDQLPSIKKFILTHRKQYGKPVRQAITGNTNGIPLETLLELPDSLLREKMGKLLNPPEEGNVPPVFTIRKQEIEENRIRHYFRKLFGFDVVKIVKLRGLRNSSFRVDCREGSFVFKRALTGDFSSLHYEKEVMLRLGEEGLSPRSPHLDLSGEFFEEAVLVYEWLSGRVPKTIEPALYQGMAEYLCRIHAVAVPSLPFMSTDSLRNYFDEFMDNFRNYMELRTLDGLGEDEFSDNLQKYISKIDDQVVRYNGYWRHEFPLSLIHGDLRPSNIVVTEVEADTDRSKNREGRPEGLPYVARQPLQNGGCKISAIDWEEARLGDPAFEVSWFFRTNNFTEQQEREFLEIYLNLYQKTFPGDKYFVERIEGYNLINHINFPLGSAIHCMELSQGTEHLSMPIPYYVRLEAESLESGFAEAFDRVEAIINIDRIEGAGKTKSRSPASDPQPRPPFSSGNCLQL